MTFYNFKNDTIFYIIIILNIMLLLNIIILLKCQWTKDSKLVTTWDSLDLRNSRRIPSSEMSSIELFCGYFPPGLACKTPVWVVYDSIWFAGVTWLIFTSFLKASNRCSVGFRSELLVRQFMTGQKSEEYSSKQSSHY